MKAISRPRAGTNLGRVHLVDGDDELTHTESEGEEGVLASLAILGDTGLELTGTTGDDEDSAVSLGGTSDHVFDEVAVSGSIDDLVLEDQIPPRYHHAYMHVQ